MKTSTLSLFVFLFLALNLTGCVGTAQVFSEALQGMGKGMQEAGRTPVEPKQSFTCIGNASMVNCN